MVIQRIEKKLSLLPPGTEWWEIVLPGIIGTACTVPIVLTNLSQMADFFFVLGAIFGFAIFIFNGLVKPLFSLMRTLLRKQSDEQKLEDIIKVVEARKNAGEPNSELSLPAALQKRVDRRVMKHINKEDRAYKQYISAAAGCGVMINVPGCTEWDAYNSGAGACGGPSDFGATT